MKLYKSEAGGRAIVESYDRLIAKWGLATQERDLEGSYGRTHVVMAGAESNPPLLLFHGVGDDSAIMWMLNAVGLAKRFRIIAADTMGAPGKSRPDGRYGKGFSLRTWYGDILDALDLRECFAAGVSYGSYHAQHILVSYPERIRKIVGIAGYVAAEGYGGSKLGGMLRLMARFLPEALVPTDKNILKLGAKLLGGGAEAILADRDIAEHFILLQRHCRPQAQMNHARKRFSRAETELLKERGLFLVGSDDIFCSSPTGKRAMQELGMKLRLYPGAGHGLNMTHAREVEAEIAGFLLGD